MSRLPPIRPPGQWPEAQHALVTRAGTDPLPETPVHAEWWTNPTTWVPERGGSVVLLAVLVAQGVRALVRRHRVGPEGGWVALRRVHGAVGPTELVVKVDPDSLPSPSGAGPAAVLGEFAPNGAMFIVLGGRRVSPVFNPQVPWGALTRRLGK